MKNTRAPSKDTLKIALGTVIVLLLALGTYHFLKKKPVPSDVAELYFHPDSVGSFDWNTENNSFSFHRASRKEQWQPAVDGIRIQRRLNFLASLQLTPQSAPSSQEIKVRVSFGKDNDWNGAFDGKRFVWTEGNKAGYGAALDEKMRILFEEGAYSFLPLKWSWCTERFQTLEFEDKAMGAFTLQQRGLQWFVTHSDQDKKTEREIDPTFVEKWLGENCDLEITSYKDFKIAGRDLISSGKLKIAWFQQPATEYKIYGDYIEVLEDKGVASDRFTQALKKVLEAPLAKKARR